MRKFLCRKGQCGILAKRIYISVYCGLNINSKSYCRSPRICKNHNNFFSNFTSLSFSLSLSLSISFSLNLSQYAYLYLSLSLFPSVNLNIHPPLSLFYLFDGLLPSSTLLPHSVSCFVFLIFLLLSFSPSPPSLSLPLSPNTPAVNMKTVKMAMRLY